METYALPFIKIEFPYDSGNTNQDSDNLEGWEEVGDGREVQEGGDLMYIYV